MKALVTFLVVLAAIATARADDYPNHAITLVAPFAAGGPTDIGARALADAIGRQLKQSVIVENIGGAGGNIGAARVARAEPDGYTLMFTNFSLALSPALYSDLSYDPGKDFAAIGVATFTSTLVLARNDLPAATFADFMTYLKTNGEKVLVGTTGPGGPSDLCARLIMKSLGATFTLVAYKGTGPAMTDLIPGHIDMMCDSIITAAPQVKAGVVKTYGVTGHERSAFTPDIPTLDEQGMKGVDYKVWSGLYAPKKTPKAVIDRLSAALVPALNDTAFKNASVNLGQEAGTGELLTPAGADAYLKSEIARWGALLQGTKPAN